MKSKIVSLLIFMFLGTSPALASTLSLSPSSGTFNQSCSFNLDIALDTQGAAADGVDAYLNFDSSRFSANTIDTQGKVYSDYPGNSIDNSAGKIVVSGLASVGKSFTGSGKLATITFSVKDSASTGATEMTFDFDVNNKNIFTDSNVVSNSVQSGTVVDTLTSVGNGNYTIGTGTCGATPAPSQAPAGGNPDESTPSATFIPVKTLPPAGSEQMTFTIAIVGSVLTILGILGLALL